jgi:5'(3')-deoxyribonucleotidase
MGVNEIEFDALIDMDSVAYDLTTPWLEWYNKESGDSLTYADILTWEWSTFIKPGWESKIYDFLNQEGMFYSLKPFPGAVEAMREVDEMGVRQRFATTVSTKTGAWEKQRAVERDFPFIGKKRVLTTGGDKAFLGDILFDDGPHNREAFAGLTVRVDLQGSPYVQDGPGDFNMTSWDQYPDIMREAILLNLLNKEETLRKGFTSRMHLW